MRFQNIAALLALGLCALPAFAAVESARTTTLVNLYAGPDKDYPVVATIAKGASLQIEGCLDDYSWCDVLVPGNLRGWVYGDYINSSRTSSNQTVRQQGVSINLPVISFTLGSYWDNHYRNRSWYNDRSRWHDRPSHDRPSHDRQPTYRPHSRPPLPPIHNRPTRETLPPIHTRPAPVARPQENGHSSKPKTPAGGLRQPIGGRLLQHEDRQVPHR